MKQRKKSNSIVFKSCFILGTLMYLCGLFLLFVCTFKSSKIISMFGNVQYVKIFKLIGIVTFVIGFVMFVIGLINYYKSNKVFESNKDLIIEGKADMITIMVMMYLMIFMVIICIVLGEYIGSLLFVVCIIIQSILNVVLNKYFASHK